MATTNTQPRYMQGVAVPAESVRPTEFFARTRRKVVTEKSVTFAGLGLTDFLEIRKSDILAEIIIKFSGTLTTTHSAGNVTPTYRWPYDLIKALRFTANGQSNLINVSGLKLKAREFMAVATRDDRGLSQSYGGSTVTQGTLSMSSEAWGLSPGTASTTAGSYPVELFWKVPVAEDQVDLSGAIFAATASTDLTVFIDWETSANLFTTSGGDTVALTGTVSFIPVKYTIPIGPDGEIVVPDLSLFHSLIQARTTSVAVGDNEIRLTGQGQGKSLLRVFYQWWANGSSYATAPLVANATNFGHQSWRFASNEMPDDWLDARTLRQANEALYNADIGALWGFMCHDFAALNAFRDVVDEGTASELRIMTNLGSGATVSGPAVEYVQETIYAAGQGS